MNLLKNKIKHLIFAIKNYYLIKKKKGNKEPKKKENSHIDNIDNEIRINNGNIINKKKFKRKKEKIRIKKEIIILKKRIIILKKGKNF